MSHSKHNKQGHSLYLEEWNPAAKRFINTCCLCGHQGYSPAVDEPDFATRVEYGRAIQRELRKTFRPLPLDERGRCAVCAAILQNS